MAFRLSIEDGPYVQTLHVNGDRLMVGKAASNQLRLTADGVSKRHAMVRQNGSTLVFTGLPTGSGFEFDGERTERVEARPGDTVALGQARITVLEITAAATLAANGPNPDADPLPDTATVEPPRPPPRTFKAPTTGPIRLPAHITPEALAALAAHAHRRGTEPPVDPAERAKRGLRQTPWWLASAGVHGLLLFVLTFVAFTSGPSYRAVEADLAVDQPLPETLQDEDELEDQPDPFEAMERPEPEPPEMDLPPMEEPPPPLEEEFTPPELDTLPDASPTAIGLGASLVGNLSGTFDKGGASSANRSAANALGQNPFSRALLRSLRSRTDEHKVRVLKGTYDKCEKVLGYLELEHGWISGAELSEHMPSAETKAILINCTDEEFSPTARLNLEQWVAEGGHLFSTDWGVENVCEACFPGYIAPLRDGPRRIMAEDATIEIEADLTHDYLKGVSAAEFPPVWWIEDSSYPVVVLATDSVEVMVRSSGLARRWGSDVVAVTFRHGKGRVVHVMGHFYQQEGNMRGTVAMQRLLLNFLNRAIRRR